MTDLLPGSLWRFPAFRFPSVWDDDDDSGAAPLSNSGLSVSEDEKNFYVQASLPGVNPDDVEVTFDKGVVWIKGENKTEEKNKKFYRRAAGSFSYRVAVPGEIDPGKDPEASSKNGVMTVTFAKSPATQPKKITVKAGK